MYIIYIYIYIYLSVCICKHKNAYYMYKYIYMYTYEYKTCICSAIKLIKPINPVKNVVCAKQEYAIEMNIAKIQSYLLRSTY